MINLNNLETLPIFSDEITLKLTKTEDGVIIVFSNSKSRNSHMCYLPSSMLKNYEVYVLSYYVENLLLQLESYVEDKFKVKLFKNPDGTKELLEFDNENRTYNYTDRKEIYFIDDEVNDKIRNHFVLLNLSLNQLGYSLK